VSDFDGYLEKLKQNDLNPNETTEDQEGRFASFVDRAYLNGGQLRAPSGQVSVVRLCHQRRVAPQALIYHSRFTEQE